jgi:hypothetical protein
MESVRRLIRFRTKRIQLSTDKLFVIADWAVAFVVQYATGVVLQHWTPQAGHYPEVAYQTAFALNLALQVVAWIWFMFPRVKIDSRQQLTREPCANLRPEGVDPII